MPTQKDLKRLVRRRMQKTGESYTAARTQLLKTPPASRNGSAADAGVSTRAAVTAAKASAKAPRAPEPDYAKLAGMSDAAIERATGCTWKKWVGHLDYVGAHEWPHRKIAEHVHEKHGVPEWWTQAVTVGYERIRGLREIGQRRGGAFEANRSRTFAVPAATLFDAFAVARRRSRWLPGVKLTVRKATPHRSLRMTWNDGTSVEVWIVAKGAGKSAAQVQHRKLPDREAAARSRVYWGERLDSLRELLSS